MCSSDLCVVTATGLEGGLVYALSAGLRDTLANPAEALDLSNKATKGDVGWDAEVEKIRLHNQYLGGGFGRRLETDSIEQAVLFATPIDETPHMSDDPQLREMTCDPRLRKVLITDGNPTDVAEGVSIPQASKAPGVAASKTKPVCCPNAPLPGASAVAASLVTVSARLPIDNSVSGCSGPSTRL